MSKKILHKIFSVNSKEYMDAEYVQERIHMMAEDIAEFLGEMNDLSKVKVVPINPATTVVFYGERQLNKSCKL